MNDIDKRQNSRESIERLAAQRELYSAAKRIQTVQLLGTIVVPAIAAVATAILPRASYFASVYGILFFAADSILLEPIIKSRKAKAAAIQEFFDCDLLEIVESELKSATDITVEEVLRNYDIHAQKAKNIELLNDWYPTTVSKAPLPIAAIICQRLNYCWDERLRRVYSRGILILNVLMACFIFGAAAIARLDWTTLLLMLTAFLPYLRVATKQYRDHMEAGAKLKKLNVYFEKLWQRIKDQSVEADELRIVTRTIQDEVFDNRKRSPLVPDMFFWFYRNTDENLMQRTADHLIDEYFATKK